MTRGKPVAASVAIVSLMLVLSGCTVSHSQTSSTSSSSVSSSSVSITSTGAALTATAARKEPSLGETSRAKDTAAFVAYWKRQGYTVTANQQTLKPDGTVKTFRFAASRPRKGASEAGTIAATITDTPPPNTNAQTAAKAAAIRAAAIKAAAKKAPPLNDTSTAKDIAAYVAFYERHGYKITLNQQTFNPDGTVQEFHFVAKRGQGANQSSVSANSDEATHNVSISEDTNETADP